MPIFLCLTPIAKHGTVILTISTGERLIRLFSRCAIAVVRHSTVGQLGRFALSSIETVTVSTDSRLCLAGCTIVFLRAITILVVSIGGKKALQVLITTLRVCSHAQLAFSSIHTGQCALWDATFSKLAMGSIMIVTTSARMLRGRGIIRFACAAIDAKDSLVCIACYNAEFTGDGQVFRGNRRNFTKFANILDSVADKCNARSSGVHNGCGAVAKKLFITIDVFETWDALATVANEQ